MSIFSVLCFGQFPEGFEGAFPPPGWVRFDNGIGTAQSWNSTTTPTLDRTGAQAAYLNREAVAVGTLGFKTLMQQGRLLMYYSNLVFNFKFASFQNNFFGIFN